MTRKWFVCEFCGKNELNTQHQYWSVEVFDNIHILCNDCKKRLVKEDAELVRKKLGIGL